MKKPRKKKKTIQLNDDSNPSSTFFLSFVGEYVELVCKNVITHTEVGVMPLIVTGYLLDVDETHLYLSDDMQNVVRAIKREDYAVIEIAKSMTDAERVLSELNIPENAEDGN